MAFGIFVFCVKSVPQRNVSGKTLNHEIRLASWLYTNPDEIVATFIHCDIFFPRRTSTFHLQDNDISRLVLRFILYTQLYPVSEVHICFTINVANSLTSSDFFAKRGQKHQNTNYNIFNKYWKDVTGITWKHGGFRMRWLITDKGFFV